MSKIDFSKAMAKSGYDPRGEHPDITPKSRPVYLGNGKWGPPETEAQIRDSRVPDPDDDGGHGSEEDEFFADLLDPTTTGL